MLLRQQCGSAGDGTVKCNWTSTGSVIILCMIASPLSRQRIAVMIKSCAEHT